MITLFLRLLEILILLIIIFSFIVCCLFRFIRFIIKKIKYYKNN